MSQQSPVLKPSLRAYSRRTEHLIDSIIEQDEHRKDTRGEAYGFHTIYLIDRKVDLALHKIQVLEEKIDQLLNILRPQAKATA